MDSTVLWLLALCRALSKYLAVTTIFDKFHLLFEQEIIICPNLIVYKAAMQRINMKFTSKAYNTYDMIKNASRSYYTYFQWTEDRQGFQIQYLTLDT